MNILDYLMGRRRLDLTTTIGDAISTYLEEVDEYISTVADQINRQHIASTTIECMVAETSLMPFCSDLTVDMWESRSMCLEL